MPGWVKHKLESRLPGEISITSDMQLTPPLWQKVKGPTKPLNESERGEWKVGLKLNIQKTKIMRLISSSLLSPIRKWRTKKLLVESERGEWKSWLKKKKKKVGLKLNIQKTKIMSSGPITSWQIDGETMETVKDFILGRPKSLQMLTATIKLKDTCSLEGKLWPT